LTRKLSSKVLKILPRFIADSSSPAKKLVVVVAEATNGDRGKEERRKRRRHPNPAGTTEALYSGLQ
jgi:hypothetical protein